MAEPVVARSPSGVADDAGVEAGAVVASPGVAGVSEAVGVPAGVDGDAEPSGVSEAPGVVGVPPPSVGVGSGVAGGVGTVVSVGVGGSGVTTGLVADREARGLLRVAEGGVAADRDRALGVGVADGVLLDELGVEAGRAEGLRRARRGGGGGRGGCPPETVTQLTNRAAPHPPGGRVRGSGREARQRAERLTAEMTAFSEARVVLASMPMPHRT